MTNVIIPDVSFYEDDVNTTRHIDFARMRQSGAPGVIIRVGQNEWEDTSFKQSWYDARQAGLPRGSYFFYDSRDTPLAQAKKWFDIMSGSYGELPLFADFEDEYNGPYKGGANFKIFLEELKRLIPNKEIIIYTGYWYFKDNVSVSLHEYYSQYALWIAAYETTAPKIPAPFLDWIFWQYSEDGPGPTWGTEGKVDLNYFNGDKERFVQRFGLQNYDPTPIPETEVAYLTSEETRYQHVNIQHRYKIFPISGITTYHVFTFPKNKIKFFVSPYIGNRAVTKFLTYFKQHFGFNGDAWRTNSSGKTTLNGYAISNGQPQFGGANPDGEGTIWVDKNNNISVARPPQAEWNQAFSFANWLVKDGVIPVINKADDWRARTAFGWRANGDIVIIVVDGKDYNERVGATFKKTAQLFLDAGCVNAVMMDGGGSTTAAMIENGLPVIIGKPSGEEPVEGQVYKQRFVAQLLGFTIIDGVDIPPVDPPIQNKLNQTVTLSNGKQIKLKEI